jgi:hypothetical protein
MLYAHRGVLDVVGGMHLAFGKHGAEHGDWSQRIYEAGLTRFPLRDVATRTIECLDETQTNISSTPLDVRQQWRHIDRTTLPAYARRVPSGRPAARRRPATSDLTGQLRQNRSEQESRL